MAKAAIRLATVGGKRMSDDNLATLTQQCHQLAIECRMLVKYDSVADRRLRYLEYGQTLLAIRKVLPNKNEFGDYVRENDLDASTPAFRSDAIWMAENWSDLQSIVSHCAAANPVAVRQWYGEQTGKRKPAKRKVAAPSTDDEDEADSDEADDASEEGPFRVKGGGDLLKESINGLALGLMEVRVNADTLISLLTENPSRYEFFAPKIDQAIEDWTKLAAKLKELKQLKR